MNTYKYGDCVSGGRELFLLSFCVLMFPFELL